MTPRLVACVALLCALASARAPDDTRFPIAARLIVDDTPYDAVVHEADLTTDVDVAGRTIESAFVELSSSTGVTIADLFVFRLPQGNKARGGLELLVANGRIDRYVGLVEGRLLVGAAGEVLQDKTLALHDGSAHVVRVGDAGFAPMPGFREWYLRHGPPISAISSALQGLARPLPDVPVTGQQGSPRNIVGIWPHGVALAALNPESSVHAQQRRWAHDWINQQFRRSLHYYDNAGRIFRADEHPNAIIGDQGLSRRYGRSETYDRPANGSKNRWTAFDHQHLEAHRGLTLFALTGSELARRVAECTLEGSLSYPGVASPAVAPFNGNTRALGWTARELAMAIAVFGADRPQYLRGARHVVESFAITMGEKDGWPWLTMPPPRCDHICPEVADYEAFAHEHGWKTPRFNDRNDARAWLLKKAEDDGLSRWAYTNELDERFRMVVVWQTGVAVGGLAELVDVLSDLARLRAGKDVDTPAPAATRITTESSLAPWDSEAIVRLIDVLDHGIRCLIERGREGAVFLNGDYAPFVQRIGPPASTFHGTTAWNVDALCRAGRTSKRHGTACRELARVGYTRSNQTALDDIGIAVYWEAVGLFGVRD